MSDADPTPDGIPRPQPAKAAKVRRWDRPKPPHDWRFWVGGAGRVLMTVGVLMFGFLAYQLWGTGIEFRASQRSLGHEFERKLEELGTSTSDVATTAVPSLPVTSVQATSVQGAPTTAASVPGSTSTSVATSATSASGGWPQIELGDVIALIDIPKIGKTVYAVAGIRTEDLKRGLGHYPDTPLPGQLGNAAFAGHRTTYGGPLFDIDQLAEGDEIRVRTITGEQYVYRMVGQAEVVSPHDYAVIRDSDPTKATLTLTSCNPRYSARKRIIVHALLDESRSGPVYAATPFYGLPTGAFPAGDDEPVPTNAAGEPIEAPDDPVVEGGTVVNDASKFEGAEALSRGWLHDGLAWPQLALWAGVLVAIVLGGYLINRKFHRYWPGIVAAAIPFVVALYFFYQNINRLLPPDL